MDGLGEKPYLTEALRRLGAKPTKGTPMQQEQAIELANRLEYRFKRQQVRIIRPGRDADDLGPAPHRVEIDLTTPIGKEDLLGLISVAEEGELEPAPRLEVSMLSVTAVFE